LDCKNNNCHKVLPLIISLLFGIQALLVGQQTLDSLMANQQYLSAYEYLLKQQEQDAELMLKKVDLALNYHLQSYYHKAFAFVNLREGESLENLKNRLVNEPTPFAFNVDSALLNMELNYPDNFKVKKALGDFYNRVYYDFGDRWGEKSEVLLEKSNSYYLAAFENGVYDYHSLYALGYYQSLFENYFSAQNWFKKSLLEKPDEALTNYSLAVTYLFDGLPRQGVSFAKQAYELYADSLSKADAARITGILYLKSEQLHEARYFFEQADKLHANYRPNQLYYLKTLVLLNDDNTAVEVAGKVLSASLYSPELPEELNSLFLSENKAGLLRQVYDQVLVHHEHNKEACGNINFHYGKLLYKVGKVRGAKRKIKQARKDFEVVFDKNHQVFEAIDQTLLGL